jgi:hypothetical protein
MTNLLTFNWGVMFITLIIIYILVGTLTAVLQFKSTWCSDLISFFCITSLVMGSVLSVQMGILTKKHSARSIPMTRIEVKQKDVYNIPEIYTYKIEKPQERKED